MTGLEKVQAFRESADADEWERTVYDAEALARRDDAASVRPESLVFALRVLHIDRGEMVDLYCGETSEDEIERLKALERRVIEWRRAAQARAGDDPDDHEARLAYEIHTGKRAPYYDPAWEDAMRHSYGG